MVRLDIFADPAMPPMSGDELAAIDLQAEMASLLQQVEGMSAAQLQDEVHQRFEFRLCAGCRKKLVANPLGLPRVRRAGEN